MIDIIMKTFEIEYSNCFVTQKTYVITIIRYKNNKQNLNTYSNEPALWLDVNDNNLNYKSEVGKNLQSLHKGKITWILLKRNNFVYILPLSLTISHDLASIQRKYRRMKMIIQDAVTRLVFFFVNKKRLLHWGGEIHKD